MDVRIGIANAREVEVEMGDDADKAAIQKDIEAVLGGKGDVLWLTDKRGRTVGVPADKIAFVEVGTEASQQRIGFVG